VTSGFRCEVVRKCALLGCYTARSSNSLPTFRDKLSVQFSRVKSFFALKIEPVCEHQFLVATGVVSRTCGRLGGEDKIILKCI
jgi:hypothetical protein